MGKLEKLKRIAAEWGSQFTFADYALGLGKWLWGIIGTSVLSLLAAVSPWFTDAGPYGWFLAGLAGIVLFGCAVFLTTSLIARSLGRFRPAQLTPEIVARSGVPMRARPQAKTPEVGRQPIKSESLSVVTEAAPAEKPEDRQVK